VSKLLDAIPPVDAIPYRPRQASPRKVATEYTDLTAELKRGLSFIRHEKPSKPRKAKS
jgi:hypothetical protein